MLSPAIISLILGTGLAAAAALPAGSAPIVLGENDVLLYGADGRMEVMHKTAYANLTSWGTEAFEDSPATNYTTQTPVASDTPTKVGARCSQQTIYTVETTSSFLDWDVQMSSVVHSNGAGTTIAVTEGYSVANGVSVSAGFSATLVKDFLSSTFSISYSETWTTSSQTSISFAIPNGKYGAIVSNPFTTRRNGRVDVGCIAQPAQTYHFQADARRAKSFGGLSWVEGAIQLCTGNTYPLRRCHGQGSLF